MNPKNQTWSKLAPTSWCSGKQAHKMHKIQNFMGSIPLCLLVISKATTTVKPSWQVAELSEVAELSVSLQPLLLLMSILHVLSRQLQLLPPWFLASFNAPPKKILSHDAVACNTVFTSSGTPPMARPQSRATAVANAVASPRCGEYCFESSATRRVHGNLKKLCVLVPSSNARSP